MSMTTKPVRLQRSRAKGSRLVSPNGLPVVCVTRPGRWGNPFKVGSTQYVAGEGRVLVRDAAHAVELYRRHVLHPTASVLFRQTVRDELRGKNLACWCRLTDSSGRAVACHADVLLEVANDPE